MSYVKIPGNAAVGNSWWFVSPGGSNSKDGKDWGTAKRTIYDGLEALCIAGGGTLVVAEGCEVGGPIPGQGIRLRSDFLPQGGYFVNAPGFLPIVPMRIVGAGRQNGGNSFATGIEAKFGPDVINEWVNPYIWIVGSLVMSTVIVDGLRAHNLGQLIYRIGVDYLRNNDGTVLEIAVANAARVGTTTTYTLTLPSPLVVTHASRTANVTTLTIPNPGRPCPPWRSGIPARVVTGHADFPAGDYVLGQLTGNPLQNNTTWTVSYPDAGADKALTAISGTLKTHGCRSGTLVNLTSTDAAFRATQYYVNSATIDTIVVTDRWGAGNADENNIGTIAVQERMYQGTTNVKFKNCSGDVQNQGGNNAGHTFDIGHTQAIRPIIEDCWFSGYVNNGSPTRDERSMSAIYVYPGRTPNVGPGVAAVTVRDSAGTNGSVYVETDPDGVGITDVRRTLIESSFLALELPAVRVDGNDYMAVVCEDVGNADADTEIPTVVLNGCQQTACHVDRSGIVKGACVGGDMWQIPPVWEATGRNEPTPWQYRHALTAWADGRITGKHPGAVRALGVTAARFKNVIADPATWTLSGGMTRTMAQSAPDATSTAVKIEATNQTYVDLRTNTTDGQTWTVGGHFAVCGWINAATASSIVPAELFRVLPTGVTFVEGESIKAGYTGTGWQFISGWLTVGTVADSTPNYLVKMLVQSAGTISTWGVTAFYVPTSVDVNDAVEYMGTLRHQPRYLPPGMVGTMEGQMLVAHGGIATAKRYAVGADSGQITLGAAAAQAIEIFDELGNSLGVVRPNAFSVNP